MNFLADFWLFLRGFLGLYASRTVLIILISVSTIAANRKHVVVGQNSQTEIKFYNHSLVPTIYVISSWFDNAHFMKYHLRAFKRVSTLSNHKLIYVALNAASGLKEFKSIHRTCHRLSTMLLCVNVSGAEGPVRAYDNYSANHATALHVGVEYILQRFTLLPLDLIFFIDPDIMPIDFNLNKFSSQSNFSYLTIIQQRENFRYPWPNLLLLRITSDKNSLLGFTSSELKAFNFEPTSYRNVGLDSGGKLLELFESRWNECIPHNRISCDNSHDANYFFRSQCKVGKRGGYIGMEYFNTSFGSLYHIGSASSNWRKIKRGDIQVRWKNLISYANELDECNAEFYSYKSSSVEEDWVTLSKSITVPPKDGYCDIIQKYHGEINEIVKLHMDPFYERFNSSIFSKFTYKETCLSGVWYNEEYIEPLIGILRDPRSWCEKLFDPHVNTNISPWYDRKYMLSREYLILQRPLSIHAYMFDLGASSFTEGPGGSSQEFFYTRYEEYGVTFDKYFMWEARAYDPKVLFARVPDKYMFSYQYFNIPVSSNIGSMSHPLGMIENYIVEDDFVSFKLDVDNEMIEQQIVDTILHSKSQIYTLIDEMFWEQHSGTLQEQYHNFYTMRNLGIRAHTWP